MKSLAIPMFLAGYLMVLGCGAYLHQPNSRVPASGSSASWSPPWGGEFQRPHGKFSD